MNIEHLVRRLAALDNDRDYILSYFAPPDRAAVAPIVDAVLAEENLTMWTFEFDTEIAGRDVTLIGHRRGLGAIAIDAVLEYANDREVRMSSAERDAFVSAHRADIEDAVRDHGQAESERLEEERASR